MTEKYLSILEFLKIRAKAVSFTTCETAANMLLDEKSCENAQEERDALACTDAMTTLLIKNGSPRFSGVDGVDDSVLRATKGGVLSMGELLLVAETLRNFKNLVSWYNSTEHEPLCVDELFYALTPQPVLEKNIFDSILSETEMADTASDALYDVRRKIRAAENSIRDKLDGIVKSQNTSKFLQETIVSLRNGRFVVPVKAEYRGEVGGVIHDVSSSGATLFVEPTAVVEANAKIMQFRSQEHAEIERILVSFSGAVASIEPIFMLGYEMMMKIDVLLAKAQLAVEQNGMMPAVREDMCFSLIRARHPLIAKDVVVPIDVSLGQAYDTLIVTGPNTGGKTVTLKLAGLLCVMAQYGYLIPAHESSEVCMFEDVLVDIGDEQSIEQSLSTFSGHITNIAGIVKIAHARTLVLIDELGAGTDPAEGAALAVAIIEELRKTGTRIMATTHYSELKMFALNTPGVQNASCEFNAETLRPTYKLNVGVPGKSNAFYISERLGLSMSVIDRAREHLSNEDRQFDNVLTQLEDLKLELRDGQDEIERLKNIAEIELVKAQEKREELIRQGENELAAARDKAKGLAMDVQSRAYGLADEMRKLEKDEKMSASQRAARAREIARHDSEKLLNQADVVDEIRMDFTPLSSVRLGQEVLVVQLGKTGLVTGLPDKAGMVEVRAGIIKTKVSLSGLCAPKKQEPVKFKKHQPISTGTTRNTMSKAVRTPSMEINLLGMNVEEALSEVDQFIDNGIMSGQTTLYIIHGRGTGKLRSAIHAHLRTHPSIKSYRLGVYGEGEDGVTVTELK